MLSFTVQDVLSLFLILVLYFLSLLITKINFGKEHRKYGKEILLSHSVVAHSSMPPFVLQTPPSSGQILLISSGKRR